ncbi:E3 ubiquitin-protein ligase TRIM39-like [Ambystoma mexicanum]|uniref:E3 ubiquitin-protein ligase TRIM39-like n=1 Tax=Ambystoma mexicanum TaxID=8296 RepID=UPI0037E7F81E
MAGANFEVLQEEATCSICLEYINDPVTIDCGHNFCRSCITHCCQRNDVICPQCRQTSRRTLQSNCQLRNIVEMLKLQEKNMCIKHKQPLQLFCEEDQQMLCLVCRESKDHKTHTVSPIEEAAQEYKLKLEEALLSLKIQKEGVLQTKRMGDQQHRTMMNQLEREKCEIAAEIEKLQKRLQEKEAILHQKSEKEKKTIMAGNANQAELTLQIDSIDAQIHEMEERCKGPALELLKDVGNTLSRWKSGDLVKPTPEMKRRKENIFKPLNIPKLNPHEVKNCKVMLTLDPNTAHRDLVVLGGRKRVKHTEIFLCKPDHHKRFTLHRAVLARESFTSGRHYWEVQLLFQGGGWTVGVAAESVSRRGRHPLSPERGVWAVNFKTDMCVAVGSPETPTPVRFFPRKLGIYLDYEEKRLSLFNAQTKAHLYSFNRAAFSERLFPFFCLQSNAELSLV